MTLLTPNDINRAQTAQTQFAVSLRWDTWRAWVVANLVAESLGLGATLLVGVLLFGGLEPRIGIVPVALLGIALGALCEGSIVGGLQWLVIRRPIPEMRWREWATATAVGAGISWALGMIPSTVMLFAPQQPPVGDDHNVALAEWAILLLAAAMGAVLGAVLGGAQWVTLRRYVPRASWWVAANAIAWATGMLLVFVGTGFIPDSGTVTGGVIAAIIVCVALAGGAVGAIHGLALIGLLRERDRALLARRMKSVENTHATVGGSRELEPRIL